METINSNKRYFNSRESKLEDVFLLQKSIQIAQFNVMSKFLKLVVNRTA
jgi:hypothetical protein